MINTVSTPGNREIGGSQDTSHPFTPPAWLKTAKHIFHRPSRTVFVPQRRIVRSGGFPELLDLNGQSYALAECSALTAQDLATAPATYIVEGRIPLQTQPHPGYLFVISDGPRRWGVRGQHQTFPDDGHRAAQLLARAFDGVVVEGDAQ